MPEPISPRLVDRVERSLRRRLHSDVRPHLMRCATHAQTEDDFIVAAARLLLNVKERHQWLASWNLRLHGDGTDTEPAPLDTVPSPLDNGRGFSHSFQLSHLQRRVLQEALAQEVGPIAELLIDNELQQCDSFDDLLDRLQTHLNTDIQRLRFVHSTHSGFPPDA